MTITTWTRNSHGLFDHESNEIIRKMLVTHSMRYLIRNKETSEVKLAKEKELEHIDANTILFKILPTSQPDRFCIEQSPAADIYRNKENCMWVMIRNLRAYGMLEKYKLKRGDIVKLGKIHLKVKDYRIEDTLDESDYISCEAEDGPADLKICSDLPKDENDVCRICFSAEDKKLNPLLAICKCTGSMKFIHFNCLVSWVNEKLEIKRKEYIDEYYWRVLECEICKTFYPYAISHKGIRHPLVNVVKPKRGSFIILESINIEQGGPRYIYLLKFTDSMNLFNIGRGQHAEMRINDISVSRMHARLTCTTEGIFLEDNNSKFGTLIHINKLDIKPSIERTVQVGRTIVDFEVRIPIIQT